MKALPKTVFSENNNNELIVTCKNGRKQND